ncbi:hypothetical protein scyTo_0020733, partial [Scyliorhinus torazame]|nr:hypothetical protein [Scyliorhinus torazame]
ASLVQIVHNYASLSRKAREFPSQLDDLSPTLLKKDYKDLELMNTTNDVVQRLLSLEMATRVIAILTAKIRNYQEHLQVHRKDKTHKRYMLMAIDRRKKLLKYLRRTRYNVFENVCTQLGIQYTFPPEYYRKVTQRWAAKKAFCIRVFQEVKKLRAAEQQKQKVAAAEKGQPVSKKASDGTAV